VRFSRFIFGLGFLSAATTAAFAASNSADALHVHVQIIAPSAQLTPGASSEAGLYFKLDPGWHVYWQNAGDSGEPPHIQWTLPDGITAGPLQFPAPQRLPLGPLMDFGYENEVLFPFNLDVASSAKPGPAVLKAKVAWLVCRELCIPGKAELEVDRVIAATGAHVAEVPPDREIYDRLVGRLPKPLPGNDSAVFQLTATGFRLAVSTGQRETQAVFFPEDQNIVDNPAPQQLTLTPKGFFLDLKKDASLTANPSKLNGVIELSGGRNFEIAATPGTVAVAPAFSFAALARVVGLAFLGGLILNLMPCVFPVLFLKGLALVNSGNEEKHKLRAHGFVYTAGILVSFWALVALLLGLRAAGSTLGWGFQFQSPVFLSLMAALLFFLGLSLAGQFEIGLTLHCGRLAGGETRLCGQLLYWRARGCCRYAVHCAVHGSGDRLRARSTCSRHFRRLHSACARPCRALRRAHASTCLDAPAAKARRVDGHPQAGYFGPDFCNRDLAGVGTC
jgi:thiol:disulfide interchange protein DsbD